MTRIDHMRDRRQRAGDWLRSAREHAGLTTGALAAAMGVHQTSVSNYETGKNAVPEDRVPDLARALGMAVIDARRGLGLWVPDGSHQPRPATPEEAVRADPTLRPDQRDTALGMLALIRGQPAPPPAATGYDPDSTPGPPA